MFLRKEICRAESADGAGPARAADEPLTVLALTAGEPVMRALGALLANRSSDPAAALLRPAWPLVSQMLVAVDVCPAGPRRTVGGKEGGVEDTGGGGAESAGVTGMEHARLLAQVQALLEDQELLPFASTRQPRLPRSPPLATALHAAGFPDLICRFRLSLARPSPYVSDDGSSRRLREASNYLRQRQREGEMKEGREEGEGVRRGEAPPASSPLPPGPRLSPHPAHGSLVRQLGQLHVCSRSAALFLTLPAPRGSAALHATGGRGREGEGGREEDR